MYALLIKHEVRQTYKTLLTMFGAALVVTASAGALVALDYSLLSAFGLVIGVVALIALPLGIMAYFWWRYYQTMYAKQGYLTMTLPVRGRVIFWAKVTWAFTMVSAGYLLMIGGWASLAGVQQRTWPWEIIHQVFEASTGLSFLWILALILLGLAATVLTGAFAITFGSEERFWKLGLGGPVLVTIGTYFVYQFVVILTMLFIPVGLAVFADGSTELVWETMLPTMVESFTSGADPDPIVVGLGCIPAIALLAGIAAVWTVRSIERRTSLR